MNNTRFSMDQLSGAGTVSVERPGHLVGMLECQAKETRAAEQALQRAQKINKGKASIAAADLYRECGI